MGKVPIRLREVVYTLSPFEQTVMNGVFKDVPEKLHRKFAEVRQHQVVFESSALTNQGFAPTMPVLCAELGGCWGVLPGTCSGYFCVSFRFSGLNGITP